MVLLDAVARRLPGAIREESGAVESFSAELEGGVEFPHYTRPAEFRGWPFRTSSSPETTRASQAWRAEREQRANAFVRGPIDRLTAGLPAPWRTVVDWVVTIVVAVGAVLAIKAWVVNPYRIPSSSMEPTLHCAEPGPAACASYSDRVLANRFIYHFRDPHRGDIVVFNTPAEGARGMRRGRHLRQADRRPPGRHRRGAERHRPHQRGAAGRAVRAGERARQPDRQLEGSRGELLHDGRQPLAVVRQPRVGLGPARRSHRARFLRVLATSEDQLSLTMWAAGSRRAEPGTTGLTTLAAGSGGRSTSPYSVYCLGAARLAPVPAAPQSRQLR